MKFYLEIEPDKNPDAVGEYLRSMFFREEGEHDVGCYTVHEWRENVEPLPPRPVDFDLPDDLQWTRGRKLVPTGNGTQHAPIECRWYWDGDGVLAFKLPDGRWLVNSDCKKPFDWRLQEERPD